MRIFLLFLFTFFFSFFWVGGGADATSVRVAVGDRVNNLDEQRKIKRTRDGIKVKKNGQTTDHRRALPDD